MEWWRYLTTAAWQLLDQHGQLAVFVLLLVEEAGTPIPIPGDFLMALAGARAAQGQFNLLHILLLMELATVLGASLLYWVAARVGRRVVFRLGRYVGLTPERLDRFGGDLHRRGGVAVVVGRLTPGLRIATPVACGVFRFPFRVFLPAMATGAFIYILAYTALGYVLGARVLALLERLEVPVGLLTSVGLLALLVFWMLRVRGRVEPAAQLPCLRERLWAGAASGLIATLQSTLLVNVLIHVAGLLAFSAPAAGLARLALLLGGDLEDTPGLALASLLVPALLAFGGALGALYGAWLGASPSSSDWLQGAAFALLPLGASLFLILPLCGAGPAGLGLGVGLVPAVGETFRHLAFGLGLGGIYPVLARPRSAPRPPAPAAGEIEPQAS